MPKHKQADWTLGEQKADLVALGPERAILVALHLPDTTQAQVTEYLDELEFLAETAGAITVERFVQRLPHPESRTFVGKGKLEEIAAYVENNDIDLVIFDDDLSAKQAGILEEHLKRKILDRSNLILDIFAARAQTAQAKAQVELAQLQYMLPRLRGLWTHLERQRGGIGMRGPGEKEIETDRRIIKEQISRLKDDLSKIDRQAQTQRKSRETMVRVSLVGYTNVGKSTLMTLLSKSEVFAENKLFATLDTTVRKVVIERTPFLLSDTVGFIRKLPHHLVESFKSTLDEVRESDLLLHVVDLAHPAHAEHIATVQATLADIGAANKRTILIFNKFDLWRSTFLDDLLTPAIKAEIEAEIREARSKQYDTETLFISAVTGEGIDHLKERLLVAVRDLHVERYPHEIQHW